MQSWKRCSDVFADPAKLLSIGRTGVSMSLSSGKRWRNTTVALASIAAHSKDTECR
jgi:hypothetical protein